MSDREREFGLDPDIFLSLPCDLILLVWGIYTLTKPGGPHGEELAVVYYTFVPLLMFGPAWVAIHSWLNHWALTKTQLFVRNAPFGLAVLLWAWLFVQPVAQ